VGGDRDDRLGGVARRGRERRQLRRVEGRGAAADARVAVEYADRGIRVNGICPGVVQTPLGRNSRDLHGPPGSADDPPFTRIRRRVERYADPTEIAADTRT
jgi:NAD(P)-dependent dehydrogenase (short-subunit alcohol dehydrogenase family)